MTTELRKERHSVSDLKIHACLCNKVSQANFYLSWLSGELKNRFVATVKQDTQNPMEKMLYGVLATSLKSVGGAPLEVLKRYIQEQEKPS